MNLHETIRLLIKEQGKNVVSSPAFMGMLDDYGAFREEEPATKTIVRELVRTGQVQRLIDSPNKGRNLHFEIRTVVSETARSGGFREDLVSVTLMEIALGAGKIQKVQDWPTLNEEKPSAKASLQPAVTAGTKIKAKAGPSMWQRIKRGIYYYADLWCMIPVVICFFGAVITLFLSVFAFFASSPEAGYWAKWLLVCVVTGVFVFITYCIVDDHEEWFVDKKRR